EAYTDTALLSTLLMATCGDTKPLYEVLYKVGLVLLATKKRSFSSIPILLIPIPAVTERSLPNPNVHSENMEVVFVLITWLLLSVPMILYPFVSKGFFTIG